MGMTGLFSSGSWDLCFVCFVVCVILYIHHHTSYQLLEGLGYFHVFVGMLQGLYVVLKGVHVARTH